MLIGQTTLLGGRLEENTPPPMPAHPALTFPGSGTSFGMTAEQRASHLLLLGAIGTGKTNAMLHILRQLKGEMGEGDVMLVFDAKLDFARFQAPGDYIITNRRQGADGRAGWNLFMELVSDGWEEQAVAMNADEMARVIFSQAIAESSQPFFPRAAQEVFSAILQAMTALGKTDVDYRLRHLNNAALGKYLQGVNAQGLEQFLKGFPQLRGALKYVGDGSSDQALGVFAELQAVTAPLLAKCFGQDGLFCVRRAVDRREGRTVFVEYDPSCGLQFQPIYRILVDLFLKQALCPERRDGHVYVLCDELRLLPRLDYFETALNFGRALGVCVIAGIQSMEQLYEVYGATGGRNIASGFQNTFCFRTNNAASRDYIQGVHGQNLAALSYLSPSGQPREETRRGSCVEDWDILSLRLGEAIVGLKGEKPFRFQIERYR